MYLSFEQIYLARGKYLVGFKLVILIDYILILFNRLNILID